MSELPSKEDNLFFGKIAESEMKAYFEIDKLMTHTIVAGATGGGKTIAAQVIAEEVLSKNRSVIIFDPTAQWSGFLRKLQDKKLLRDYDKFAMNKDLAKSYKGNIHIIKNPREKIDLIKYIKPGEIHVFVINQLDPAQMELFVASTVSQVFHSNLPESRTLKSLIIYDEVHRLLPKFGGNGEGFIQIERACREFRKWGLGVMLISQVLSDFVGQIKANINTEIQMRTKDENDLERIKMKYGDEFITGVLKANVGTGVISNTAYNKGRPYFVSFRPIYHSVEKLNDADLLKYKEYNERVENLEYQFSILEEKGVDVFDYNLELKLAMKKLMIGGFNMVKIYLEGLEPRVLKSFEKLGIPPPKKPIILVSEEVIRKNIAAAKELREQLKKAENLPKEESPSYQENTYEEDERDDTPEVISTTQKAKSKYESLVEKLANLEEEKGRLDDARNIMKKAAQQLSNLNDSSVEEFNKNLNELETELQKNFTN